MQEGMTVSFDPAYLEPRTTWFEKLFVLYLFSMLVMTVYRTTRIAWRIRKLRKLEAETSPNGSTEFVAY